MKRVPLTAGLSVSAVVVALVALRACFGQTAGEPAPIKPVMPLRFDDSPRPPPEPTAAPRLAAVEPTARAGASPVGAAPVALPATPEDAVRELVAILGETKSVDTFCLTLETLVALHANGGNAGAKKFNPALVLPAVIRNADRLEVLKGLTDSDEPTRAQKTVADAIAAFTGGVKDGRCPPRSGFVPAAPSLQTVPPAASPPSAD